MSEPPTHRWWRDDEGLHHEWDDGKTISHRRPAGFRGAHRRRVSWGAYLGLAVGLAVLALVVAAMLTVVPISALLPGDAPAVADPGPVYTEVDPPREVAGPAEAIGAADLPATPNATAPGAAPATEPAGAPVLLPSPSPTPPASASPPGPPAMLPAAQETEAPRCSCRPARPSKAPPRCGGK